MSSTMHGPGGPSVLTAAMSEGTHIGQWSVWSMGAQALMFLLAELDVIKGEDTYWLGVDSLTNWQDKNEQRNTL